MTEREIRTVNCWVVYNPKKREIESMHKYKYQAQDANRLKGRIVINLRGTYAR